MTQTAPVFGPAPTRPPYDPELLPGLAAIRAATPPLSDETLEQMREITMAAVPGREPVDLTAGGQVQVQELTMRSAEAELPIVVLSPAEGPGPWPLIYFIHGGGMVAGGRHLGLDDLLSHVVDGSAVVASLEYRRAPEYPDPTPVLDCYDGLRWCAENSGLLRIDPSHIIITGTSAGGGLAAGTALMARDEGFPQLSHQVLVCPMLDDRFETHSSRMLDDDGTWDRNGNLYGWTALLGERRGTADVSYYAAPARAQDLSGLPRTFIDVGSAEGFRDEAIIYATKLSEAGVSVDLHMWGGGFHGFENIAQAAVSQAASATRAEFFRRALER
ncbi:alpha/beta hydrolase [Mycolicibacterium fortuitum]|uniref:Alpha/beta hydrolase domain-containing protein n=1 Tax=Mycolicibacterium fortuitum subsp. fortuitum DSM 46621 = ATCC 6841 = JCM 6387 TaxID=1214102 RepID=K0UJG4_MYCFO|nr:alpha/beta hydrolase fold domain-containing protein [Mycolicibacterium fortuitum]AIY48008.1 Esterase/lipase [Mycobacterium sp. VKM Ac-1817D]CRL82797.1 lipase [Mycolicibacter nonchromogenicus]EJZ06941.1 alpha/beta hydrolase domain-containing protein [Mycolicibacterium fortuitum subsp. fortuitum DSM 46621 = ATCC 6841 = JCM 6387]MBP3086577.1 alpha/beta hydrolase fold domain-containing protein [Mycolicibacterium fortuitum]WEV31614.1 alpha/beta hydrolase [Mycolicibacterium fortuitum]